MDCLALAHKLAAKNHQKQTPLTPISSRKVVRSVVAVSENTDSNKPTKTESRKAHFAPSVETSRKVVPISTVFTDENLNRYFKRFLTQRKCESVLEFVECAYKYAKNFPTTPEKRVKAHRGVMEKLGTLPSQFIKAATAGSSDMASVSPDSFVKCTDNILSELEKREYKAFSESELYSKWILKYQNVNETF